MSEVKLSLVQATLHWEDPGANRQHLGELLSGLPDSDIVVLPEMFTTGFSTASTAAAETMQGETVLWMQEISRKGGFFLVGSVKILSAGKCFNRCLWVSPEGAVSVYDKRHLFRMAGEHERYAPGTDRVVVECKGLRVLLQVCYDLRFPVFSRNRDDYDLVIYVANWPAARRTAWRQLLPARAIENLAYCVGVNRIGTDGNGIDYAGDSLAFDFKGEALADLGDEPTIVTVSLDKSALDKFREKFPAHLDADLFKVSL